MQQRGNCPALLRGVDGATAKFRQTGLRGFPENEEKSSHERPRRHPRRCLHRLRQHRDLALRPGARAGQFQRDKARGFDKDGRPADSDIAAKLRRATVDVGAIIDFASSFGTLVLTRAYADWSCR